MFTIILLCLLFIFTIILLHVLLLMNCLLNVFLICLGVVAALLLNVMLHALCILFFWGCGVCLLAELCC